MGRWACWTALRRRAAARRRQLCRPGRAQGRPDLRGRACAVRSSSSRRPRPISPGWSYRISAFTGSRTSPLPNSSSSSAPAAFLRSGQSARQSPGGLTPFLGEVAGSPRSERCCKVAAREAGDVDRRGRTAGEPAGGTSSTGMRRGAPGMGRGPSGSRTSPSPGLIDPAICQTLGARRAARI